MVSISEDGINDAMERMKELDDFLQGAIDKFVEETPAILILDVVKRQLVEMDKGYCVRSEKNQYTTPSLSFPQLKNFVMVNGGSLRDYSPPVGPYIVMLDSYPFICLDMSFILSDKEDAERAARLGEVSGIYDLKEGKFIKESEFTSEPPTIAFQDADGTLREFNSVREMTEWVQQSRMKNEGDKPIYH